MESCILFSVCFIASVRHHRVDSAQNLNGYRSSLLPLYHPSCLAAQDRKPAHLESTSSRFFLKRYRNNDTIAAQPVNYGGSVVCLLLSLAAQLVAVGSDY